MRVSLIDTDILSMFFRNDPEVTARFASYLARHKKINISIITYYEIMSGLIHRDAQQKMSLFLDFDVAGRPLHVVAGINNAEKIIVVITAYEPDPLKWSDNFTGRIQ